MEFHAVWIALYCPQPVVGVVILAFAFVHVVGVSELHRLYLLSGYGCCGEVIPEGIVGRGAWHIIFRRLVIDIEDHLVVTESLFEDVIELADIRADVLPVLDGGEVDAIGCLLHVFQTIEVLAVLPSVAPWQQETRPHTIVLHLILFGKIVVSNLWTHGHGVRLSLVEIGSGQIEYSKIRWFGITCLFAASEILQPEHYRLGCGRHWLYIEVLGTSGVQRVGG